MSPTWHTGRMSFTTPKTRGLTFPLVLNLGEGQMGVEYPNVKAKLTVLLGLEYGA